MKKKWVFVVIGLLLIVGMIGAGGKVYMDNQRDKNEINVENERIQIAQKKIALYLIRNYEDVEKIEFRNFNEMKGIGYTSWSVSVDVNKDNTISFSMNDLSKVEDATIRHNPKTFSLKKKDEDLTKNLDEVQIIYWEGE